MNYNKLYDTLISNAIFKNRVKSSKEYFELHHIVPLSLGGLDQCKNTVLLTAREHFIAHWLLYKIHKGTNRYKMAHAWFSMTRMSNNQKRYTSKNYEKAKIAHSQAVSVFFKNRKISDEEMLKRKSYNPNEKKVEIDGVCFNSIKKAAAYYNVLPKLVRQFEKGEITLKYLNDQTYRQEVKNQKISSANMGTNKGKTYEEMYGNEKALEMKEAKRKAKLGLKLSVETKKKIGESRRGKSSSNKGIPMSDQAKKKLSDARKGVHVSSKNYKVIESSGIEHIVKNIGLMHFWRTQYNCERPGIFKSLGKTEGFKKCQQGKWKGFVVYVIS